MRHCDPRNLLLDCGIFRDENGNYPDFHSLSTDQCLIMVELAIEFRYRKPKMANGSRARYFYEQLVRKT